MSRDDSRRRVGESGSKLTVVRSLRARVFFAIVAVGMVPVMLLIGYLIYVEAADKPVRADDDAEGVYAAWALGSNPNDYDDEVLTEVRSSIDAQVVRLGARKARDLLRHVELLLGASGGGYEFGSEDALSPDRALAAEGSDRYENGVGLVNLRLSEEAMRELRTQGYYWGSGQYQWEEIEPGADPSNEDNWMTYSSATPIVAWMTGPDTADYVQLTAGGYSGGGETPHLWLWLLGLFAVGMAVVSGFALLVSALAMRGVDKPLRLATVEAEAASSGASIAVAPLVGPPAVRRLTRAVNRLAAQSSRAQRAEQSFLLSVSHELKTPLTSLRGYGEGLKDGALEPVTAGEVIVTESTRLERFVQDLLDSARFGRGEFTVRHEKVDLATLARDAVERHRATASGLGVCLSVESDGDGGAVAVADPDRVVQIVSNLVENAVRCTPGGATVTVTVGPGRVAVADTGPGLGADDLEHAFERFYLHNRYGRDRKIGTGLGLAIVKDLVEKMDGSVSVASEVGVGSTFTVRLPVEDVRPHDGADAFAPTGVV